MSFSLMVRVPLATFLMAAAVGLGLLAAVPARAIVPESVYCHPTGDYCQGSVIKEGRRHLMFTTFSLRGRMRLCVQAPRGEKVCKRWRLRSIGQGLWEIDVTWRAHYPRRGSGVYRARFNQGKFYGPLIRFRA